MFLHNTKFLGLNQPTKVSPIDEGMNIPKQICSFPVDKLVLLSKHI